MNSNTPSNISLTDRKFMAAAIRYARQNEGQTGANPSVGCVIVAKIDNELRIIGAGVTAKGGRPHAEPIALQDAQENAPQAIKGATAYVTLEPCAHHGATPPCARTLVNAGIARVVSAYVDPDERVNQQGHEMLEEGGVQVTPHCLQEEAQISLRCYLTNKTLKRAHISLKLATSNDGYLGAKDENIGERQVKITGDIANHQTHLLRARHHAILVGAQTIIDDNPSLTCRLNGLEERSPTRIILDPNGRVPIDAKVFQTANQVPTIIVTDANAHEDRHQELAKVGVQLMTCERVEGAINLGQLAKDLSANGIQSILVEGGAKTAQAFLKANLVDELILLRGQPNLSKDYKNLVASPVTTANALNVLGKNYSLLQELHLGQDQLTHYIRT
ncbi:MAG: bifunctional diaminohydroxyphosphoribosylaminopyrimidine deaminase/5-amino-6-(5-phosphoribosylamino)uracil reductase RibD [Nitratireductor sp.]